jgi:hypothetical protein
LLATPIKTPELASEGEKLLIDSMHLAAMVEIPRDPIDTFLTK